MDQSNAGITHKPQGRLSLNAPPEIYITINYKTVFNLVFNNDFLNFAYVC